MKKKLMIIGAGHEQVPAIIKATEMGCEVIATDLNPQAPGAALADVFEVVSTNDAQGNLAIARKYQIDGVMTLGSELAVPVVAHIVETLNLYGLSEDTALKATDKNAMREAFVANAVPTPLSQPIATLQEAYDFVNQYGYPVVLKPSDSSGQRGVTKVDSPAALQDSFSSALSFSRNEYAIIECYCAGPEINVTAAVSKGEVTCLSVSNRVTAEPPHFGIAIEHIAPPAVTDEALEAIKRVSAQAIHAIGLEDGIAYPQLIMSEQGPQLIEIAARIPGGHMREVALACSGIDMVDVAILQALGQADPLARCPRTQTTPAVSVKFITVLDYPSTQLSIKKISGLDAARHASGVQLVRYHLKIGDKLPELSSSTARFGAVIAYAENREQACQRSKNAAAKIHLEFAD